MTNQQSNPEGTISDDELRWLTARADGGFGLLQTAVYIAPAGQVRPGQLGVSSDHPSASSSTPRTTCVPTAAMLPVVGASSMRWSVRSVNAPVRISMSVSAPSSSGLVLQELVELVRGLFASRNIDILDLSLRDVTKLPAHAPEGSSLLIDRFRYLPCHGNALGVAGRVDDAASAQWVLGQGIDLAYISKAAIADHAFAQQVMTDPDYPAPSFPVTRDHLRGELLGEPFIDYFATNWPHLISG